MREHSLWNKTLVVTGLIGTLILSGCSTNTAPVHGNSVTSSSSSKKQGYFVYSADKFVAAPSLTRQWLHTNAAAHTVDVALKLPANNLSLNDYYRGFAAIDVPVNWKVTVKFDDANPDVSGQLVIVRSQDVKTGNTKPAIVGGQTPKTTTSSSSTMEFTPSKTGVYVIESVPTAQSGTWLWFVVTPASSQPQVRLRK